MLHACEVPHHWILRPEERILTVYRHELRGYLLVLSAGADETVRAEPFDAVELRVGTLFDEDDEE